MIRFVFVTQSQDKLAEAERILGQKLEHRDIDLPEIQAIKVDDVVTFKVKLAYAEVKQPVIVEDTGLHITAWNDLPGALIKWFLQSVGPVGICRMLHQFEDRSAWAKTLVATYDGKNNLVIFEGRVDGRIAEVPAGNGGFGWDTIFIPNGLDKTFGEMRPEEKDQISMRQQAFLAMKQYFASHSENNQARIIDE